MGQSNSTKINFLDQYNIKNNVLTQNQFNEIIQTNKKLFHEQMLKANIWAKIFICEKETDEDRADPGYIENCEVDEICDDYKNRYYVAQLKTKQTANPQSIADLIWQPIVYHEYWAYGFDIYEYHKTNPSHKKLILKDYFVCEYLDRKGYNMSNDFEILLSLIQKLNRDIIENKVIAILTEEIRKKKIAQINETYNKKISEINDSYNKQIAILA